MLIIMRNRKHGSKRRGFQAWFLESRPPRYCGYGEKVLPWEMALSLRESFKGTPLPSSNRNRSALDGPTKQSKYRKRCYVAFVGRSRTI